MAKFLGHVELGANEDLEKIGEQIGVYLDKAQVWDEADTYMEENDTDSAEVRIRGLDYITVYK